MDERRQLSLNNSASIVPYTFYSRRTTHFRIGSKSPSFKSSVLGPLNSPLVLTNRMPNVPFSQAPGVSTSEFMYLTLCGIPQVTLKTGKTHKS